MDEKVEALLDGKLVWVGTVFEVARVVGIACAEEPRLVVIVQSARRNGNPVFYLERRS